MKCKRAFSTFYKTTLKRFIWCISTLSVFLGIYSITRELQKSNPGPKVDNRPLLVLGMLSPFSHTQFREGQRHTWISTMQRLNSELPFRIIYKFLIDIPTNDTIKENNKYNDIVFLNATHQGRAVRFGEKLYLWLRYVHKTYPDALLAGKVDDDTFLCVPQIFVRLSQLKSQRLYYGWKHSKFTNDVKIVNVKERIDEMFVILGKDLIERIAKRRYCTGTKCNANVDLIDTDFGGTSLGSWLSIYDDIDIHPDNKRIIQLGRGKEGKIERNIKPDFCLKYLIQHKASVDVMSRLHGYNNVIPG
ncbi:uncharacterized protein [Argopecten irradians]|uniref:uncharacterized protein n=1 Tax=Argopecten irradians TaxID=31199 RepID=UPI003720B0A5